MADNVTDAVPDPYRVVCTVAVMLYTTPTVRVLAGTEYVPTGLSLTPENGHTEPPTT